jgi:hypothetical protein
MHASMEKGPPAHGFREVDVVTTDIVTSNGVIHVIDGVVLPPQE